MLNQLSSIEIAVLSLVAIFLSMVLHEIMHGYIAYLLGDDTAKVQGRLTLNPIAHIDPMTTLLFPIMTYFLAGILFGAAKPVQINPSKVKYDVYGVAIISFAGPLTNLVLAILSGLILRTTDIQNIYALSFVVLMLKANVGFFVFNMLPIPPLDGSRVLYAIAPDGVREILDRIEAFGFIALLAIMFFAYQFIGTLVNSFERTLVGWIL